jgi:hypothetical protein
MSEPVVNQSLFDEAVRIGNRSVTEANRQMRINRIAVDAIADALGLIKTGRITQARDRLDRALLGVTRLSA